ncbi:hypothetical protein VP01_750g1 [Puccinia sorghi]|uniref:Uncharacterized protein n=1 Tax=Puccinia sorghi TaxID=27349 RepID=A0A0L6UC54_9BASI|nr:hypothetical protein VP01_750g1 [Puccinia sorghi]
MRILASNAICYLFFVISQLATPTQGAFLKFGQVPQSATGASEGASESALSGARAVGFADQHSYWYPASDDTIDEMVAKQELRIFPPSPKSSSSSKPPSLASKLKRLASGRMEKERKQPFHPCVYKHRSFEQSFPSFPVHLCALKLIITSYSIPLESSALTEEDQRRKAFLEDLLRMVDVPVDFHINMIQLCFKSLLKKPNLNEKESLKWLDVLNIALHKQRPFARSKAISVLYGVYSLRLRYLNDHRLLPLIATMKSPESPEFLRNIDDMIVHVKGTHLSVGGEGEKNLALDAAWEKANKDSFMTFIKNDEELSNGMNDNISTKTEALKTLQQNFKSYSAQKRVAILAALYHQMASPTHELKQPIELLKHLSGFEYLFPHERELLQWIRGETKLRRSRQAS